jgi:hypothetical protein
MDKTLNKFKFLKNSGGPSNAWLKMSIYLIIK